MMRFHKTNKYNLQSYLDWSSLLLLNDDADSEVRDKILIFVGFSAKVDFLNIHISQEI